MKVSETCVNKLMPHGLQNVLEGVERPEQTLGRATQKSSGN
jgi:hypothetical protein